MVVVTFRDPHPVTQALRALALLALGLALAAPYLRRGSLGRDLVVVLDRSRSMPPGATARAKELLRLAEDARRDDDRVALVTFGADAEIEQLPSSQQRFQGFEHDLDVDGSELGRALERAIELIPAGRHGSILVVSDGEVDAEVAVEAGLRAAAADVRVDAVALQRERVADVSVERIDLPRSSARTSRSSSPPGSTPTAPPRPRSCCAAATRC